MSQILRLALGFLSRGFPIWQKMSGQQFEYLKNEKSFKDEIKTILHHS